MSDVREFRPELMPRWGEFNAWALALLLGVALAVGTALWPDFPFFFWIFEGLGVFIAAAISLGNWVDRRTVLRLSADGVAFENGLRSVRLSWSEVQSVAVAETPAGKRIQVVGQQSHFLFKTRSVMSMFGQSVSSGFAAGQEILDTILRQCGMKLTKEAEGVYYYARP